MNSVFFLLAVAVLKISASYRYGLMNGQIPLGEVAAGRSLPLQECGKFCAEQSCPGLIYESGYCTCYSQITGYADAGAQSGYIQIDETHTSCLTTAEHQAIIKDMVYVNYECPQGFDYDSEEDICCCDWNENKCGQYGAWYVEWYDGSDQYHCHVATYSNA